MSNAAFSTKFDEFFRLELSSIVGSETFQFPSGLIFNHCEPIGEDREHPIFGSYGVSPHLPSRVFNKINEVEAPPRDLCGIGPHTFEWTKSSGLHSLGADVGYDAATYLPY